MPTVNDWKREDNADVVRAIFPGGNKQYHYRVPGARIGDKIFRQGTSGPATVVAKGRDGKYTGEIRTAELYFPSSEREAKAMGCSCTWFGGGSIAVFDSACAVRHKGDDKEPMAGLAAMVANTFTAERVSRQLHNANPLLGRQAIIPIHLSKDLIIMNNGIPGGTVAENIQALEDEAKRLRKQEKKRKADAKELAARQRETARRRAVGYAALERIAANGDGVAAVKAAAKLIY